MKKYRIHLIRHGLTQGNVEGRYVGVTDLPLCDKGISELKSLKSQHEYPDADLIFTSPLLRCIQTANVIYEGQDYMIADDLIECNFGVFENKNYCELKDNDDFKKWISGDVSITPPNGESTLDFIERCVNGFSKIAEYLMKTGIESASIITHGGVIMSILSSLAYPKKSFYDWMVSNGMGYTVSLSPQLWMSGSIIEVINILPIGNNDVGTQQQRDLFNLDNLHDDKR